MPSLRDSLIEELKIVRRFGLHRLDELMDELPELTRLATATRGAGTADDIERMMRQVWQMYDQGPIDTAVAILLGLRDGRGKTPDKLRRAAAESLHYSVEAFRKRPEHNAIAHFADLLMRYATDMDMPKVFDPDKVDHIMALISGLTLSEYDQLMGRLRDLSASLTQDPHIGFLDFVGDPRFRRMRP